MISEREVNATANQLIIERYRAFASIGLPILTVFGIGALSAGESVLLGLIATSILVVAIGLRQIARERTHHLTLRAGLACLTVMMLYLVTFSGPEHSRALWFFMVPLGAIMLLPPREGIIWSALAITSAVGIMSFGSPSVVTPDYSFPFILRFAITASLIAGGLAWTELSLRRFQVDNAVQRAQVEAEGKQLKNEIARRMALENELRVQATTDALTALSNRRAFMQRFEHELARAQRHGPPPTLAILDIDHFKKINDVHGHPAGDAVIAHLASLLRASVRNVDIVGRIGGEEFAVVLVETSADMGQPVIDRLIERVRNTTVDAPDGKVLRFTVSIGSTEIQWGDVVDTAIQRADDALYEAKNTGRNRHCRH